jgi:hypothetical protein
MRSTDNQQNPRNRRSHIAAGAFAGAGALGATDAGGDPADSGPWCSQLVPLLVTAARVPNCHAHFVRLHAAVTSTCTAHKRRRGTALILAALAYQHARETCDVEHPL